MEFKFKTIKSATTAEFKDRGSKFFAFAYPVINTQQVKELLQSLKKLHPKAVHFCYAYRLGTDKNDFRANDDGEPSGSAGKPILGQIDSAGLTNVFVVVVRYFGGTLLGVPGLINAYKTATAEALSIAEPIEHWIERKLELEFEYPVMNEVQMILKQSEATIYVNDLQLFCRIVAGIPLVHFDTYFQKLTELRGVTVKLLQ